ncbi:class I adenylate-forming enzyme family protein [Kitasatospora sp. NPDC057198]|uniref:class I adenylate-forming enzyme family protein n=1 Tax=Kitasatospora sp. NPDC057198 TaxID=3346046 RepID=UPI0036280CA6
MKRITPFSRTPATGRYGEAWHVAARRFPDQQIFLSRPADIAPGAGTRFTYRQWAALVDDVAARLYAAGVRPWDRVAVMKANHPDVQVIGSAAARIGAIPFQLAWNHGNEVATTLLERMEQPFLVTDPGRLETAELDERTLTELTRRTIVIGAGSRLPSGTVSFESLAGSPAAPVELRAFDEPMVATHTSGTTGIPKLALHSAETLHAIAHVQTERWGGMGFRHSDTFAFFDPFFHQHTLTALFAIATVGPKYLAVADVPDENIADLLAEHRPTIVDMLPNMYLHQEHLLDDPRRLFKQVRFYISSFDAVHTRSIRRFLNASDVRLPVWVQSWSQTENGGLVLRPYFKSVVREVGQFPPPTQYMGWPLPTVARIRITDPVSGKELPKGEVGLVEIDQPGRCLAYVGEQNRHDNKVSGWWWNTGDLGIKSRSGMIRLVDREIDRIEGTSGIAIEDVLLDRLPEASEVVVLARRGGRPGVAYATYSGREIAPERWRSALAGLPALEDPIHLDWDAIPRTASWKVKRVALRQQLFDETPLGTGSWS